MSSLAWLRNCAQDEQSANSKCQVHMALLLPSFAGSTGSGRCAHTALGTFCAEPTFRKRLLQVHTWEVEPLVGTIRVVTCDHLAIAELLAETIQFLVITVLAFLSLAVLAFAFLNHLGFFTKVEVHVIDFG